MSARASDDVSAARHRPARALGKILAVSLAVGLLAGVLDGVTSPGRRPAAGGRRLDGFLVRPVSASTGVVSSFGDAAEPTGEVACHTSTSCLAIAVAGGRLVALTTTDAGATWSPVDLPAAGVTVAGLRCPVPTSCYLAGERSDGAFLASLGGGRSWSAVRLGDMASVSNLACPLADECLVSGVAKGGGPLLLRVTRGLAVRLRVPPGALRLGALACPASSECLLGAATAAGATVERSTDLGSSWTRTARRGPPRSLLGLVPVALKCVGPSACYAVDAPSGSARRPPVIERSTDKASSFTVLRTRGLPSVTTRSSPSLSCVSEYHCLLALSAGALYVTGDGGARFETSSIGAPASVVPSVATGLGCSSAAPVLCVVAWRSVGFGPSGLSVARKRAASGVSLHLSPSFESAGAPPVSVDCATDGVCLVGAPGYPFPPRLLRAVAPPGTGAWLKLPALAGYSPGSVTALSCAGGACAVETGEAPLGAGHDLSMLVLVSPSTGRETEVREPTTAIGPAVCSVELSCAVGLPRGPFARAEILSGGRWRGVTLAVIASAGASTAELDCSSARSCVAVVSSQGGGLSLEKTTDGGVTWRVLRPSLDGRGGLRLSSLSCGPNECGLSAVLPSGRALLFTTHGDTTRRVEVRNGALRGPVSCGRAGCAVAAVLGTQAGLLATSPGRAAWRFLRFAPGAAASLLLRASPSVACPDTSVCLAVHDLPGTQQIVRLRVSRR